jgi:hypothetical protein
VANLRAIAIPIPVPPPVTTAFFPVSVTNILLNNSIVKYTHVSRRNATLDLLRNIVAHGNYGAKYQM